MGVRPNIQSLELDGANLFVRGESDRPLPDVLQVVVVQKDRTADGRGEVEVEVGVPERASSNWKAKLGAAGFEKGPAEALGVEVRTLPFEVTSWTQSVTIA